MCLIRCNAVAVFCLLHWFVVANKNNILSGSYSDQIHDGNEYIGVQGWDRDKLSTSMPIDNVQSSARVLKLPEKIARVKLSSKPNLLFIVSDQLRFDAIRLIQDRRSDFEGFTKINTPSLDRLAKSGIVFDTAYCVSPSCAPSRTAGLKAGVSLQRSGIKGNGMVDEHVYRRMQMVEDKVEQLESLEQLLVEEEGYTAETYGKWHVPISLYYRRGDVNKEYPIISNNVYDFKDDRFLFRPDMQFKPVYKRDVEYLVERDGVDPGYRKGQQENYESQFAYTPIQTDPRYQSPTRTNLTVAEGFQPWQIGSSDMAGVNSLPMNYSCTAVLAQIGLKALGRLAGSYESTQQPFSLQMHFSAPHPPQIASSEFARYYLDNVDTLRLPPSLRDDMNNSAYAMANERNRMRKNPDYPFSDPVKVAELQAVYYGMVEELDHWVGALLDELAAHPVTAQNTLIVFTSDHGDMLGAHSMVGKGTLLEEASRVALMMAFPGRIPSGRVISTPVSHMDIFATVLDYFGAAHLDRSDGSSLRRYIDRTSTNAQYDERVAVTELDKRLPVSSVALTGRLGDVPNFAIRKGSYKLLLPKLETSPVLDMMYDLDADPYEMNNLLGDKGLQASDAVVGKAEHLKVLLVEWMVRMDGPKRLYSSKRWNLGEGRGDVREIQLRRTWRRVDFWASDQVLQFGPPATSGGKAWLRHEYLYVGRTMPGLLNVTDVVVTGPDAERFATDFEEGTPVGIRPNNPLRIRVTLRYGGDRPPSSNLRAGLLLYNSATTLHYVALSVESDPDY